ncbi:MAG: dihydroorotate dehydrogenase [Anaerolineales bacterium]
MPDWSYHPLFKPLLFRLPAGTARHLTLNAIGALARFPGGSTIIELFGHMTPPSGLARTIAGLRFASPVGLGVGIDPGAVALPALARFGFGFVEVGPVTLKPVHADAPIARVESQQSIRYPLAPVNAGADALHRRLTGTLTRTPLPVPCFIRVAPHPSASPTESVAEVRQLIEYFAQLAAGVVLDATHALLVAGWSDEQWHTWVRASLELHRPVLICLPTELAPMRRDALIERALACGAAGVLVEGGACVENGERLRGAPTHEASVEAVRAIRACRGSDPVIAISGGVHQPADALTLLNAGADLILVDTGLVYGGPGLPKRINEALAFRHQPRAETSQSWWPLPAWAWLLFLGLSMLIGGGLAWWIAATRVVLPYDEAFVGLTREQLAAINPRLLPFMSHDRITLAGTILAIGVLYTALAWYAVRRREHWAQRAITVSAAFGFASFFLFLGFGYFDPLHATVSVILFVFFVLGLRWRADQPPRVPVPDLHNDARWRAALWGQFLFVVIALGLIGAGVTIMGIGVTDVFVPEDLRYLALTRPMLAAVNERVIPLIAHDRAGFGGALVSDGLALLMVTLWGYRRGARWLWWTYVLSGLPGFVAALGVHVVTGYLDLWHLTPGILALGLYVPALILTYPYLATSSQSGLSSS